MAKDKDTVAKGDIIECMVESLAFGGKGVARYQGLAVFVDRAVPGQKVRCEITKSKKRFAEARRREVLVPAENEIEAFCKHFGSCGGCVHQDLPYNDQLYWKGRQVSETLQRIGRISADVPGMGQPAVGSPKTTGYRNKMEFSFSGKGASLSVGFKRRGSETEVLNIADCPLLPEPCAAIPGLVRDYCAETGRSAYLHGRGGYWRKLVVRMSHATGDIMVHMITAPGDHGDIQGLERSLFSEIKGLKTFAHSTRKGRADLATGEKTVSICGEPFITESLVRADRREVLYRISPNSFFQTNSAGAQELYRKSAEMLAAGPEDVVYDLFCGSGGIGLFIAGDVKQVVGIEISEETVRSAEENAELNVITNTRYLTGNLAREKDFPRDLPKPDIVIVDPPRSGITKPVVDRIRELGPEKLLYISCNPSTLARDVHELADAYTADRFTAVDMFPHTFHVECIALLTRAV